MQKCGFAQDPTSSTPATVKAPLSAAVWTLRLLVACLHQLPLLAAKVNAANTCCGSCFELSCSESLIQHKITLGLFVSA
jgi:hypothetical protein